MFKDRLANTRPIVFFAILLSLGVLLSALIVNNTVALIVTSSVLGATVLLSVILFIKRHSYILLFVSVVLTIGMGVFLIDYFVTRPPEVSIDNAFIEGRVDYVKDGALYLEDVKLDGEGYDGRLRIYLSSTSDAAIGDFVVTRGDVYTIDFDLLDISSATLINDGIMYTAETDEEISIVGKDTIRMREKVRNRLSISFSEVFNRDQQGIAEALMFGDKRFLDTVDNEEIRVASLSHIFAVSGLHVGFLSAIILWIFKKLRIKGVISLIVTDIILFLYMYLCGNSPSILRAIIMTTVVMLAKVLRLKADSLSCLGTAVAIIVLTDPTMLFDLGFLMSVGAVGGLILFHGALERPFRKVFRFKPISSSVAASVSSTLGIFPAMTEVFGSVSIYFALANFLVLPLVTVLYTLLAIASVGAIISPIFAFLLYPSKWLITVVMFIVRIISLLPYSTVSVGSMGIATVFYVLILVVLSRFIIIEKKKKAITAGVLSATALLVYIIFCSGLVIG